MRHLGTLAGMTKSSHWPRETSSTLVDLSKQAKGDAAFPPSTTRLGAECLEPVMATKFAGDESPSQHLRPDTDRSAYVLEGGQHLGAQCEIREARVGEKVGVTGGRVVFVAGIVLDV